MDFLNNLTSTVNSSMDKLGSFFNTASGFPTGDDYQAQAIWGKKQETLKGFKSLAGELTSFLNPLIAKKDANDLRDQTAAAKAVAYQNAVAIANYKKQLNTQQAEYTKNILNDNANLMIANAYNLRAATDASQVIQQAAEARDIGSVRANSAASGAAFSGSNKSIMTAVVKSHETSQYQSRVKSINDINELLNNATRTRLQAAMTTWSAQEQNKFIDINTQQSLY